MNADHPLAAVWTRPRATIRGIITRDPQQGVITLACLAGFLDALEQAAADHVGDDASVPAILGLVFLLGPLGGLILLLILGYLLRWSGTWLGGIASRQQLRAAYAWAQVPQLCNFAFWLPGLVIFGREMFSSAAPRMAAVPSGYLLSLIVALVQGALALWTLVLACHTIAEVQGFESAWRGLANLVLATLVAIVPVAIVMLAIFALGGR